LAKSKVLKLKYIKTYKPEFVKEIFDAERSIKEDKGIKIIFFVLDDT